jgi:hypothetical protein
MFPSLRLNIGINIDRKKYRSSMPPSVGRRCPPSSLAFDWLKHHLRTIMLRHSMIFEKQQNRHPSPRSFRRFPEFLPRCVDKTIDAMPLQLQRNPYFAA